MCSFAHVLTFTVVALKHINEVNSSARDDRGEGVEGGSTLIFGKTWFGDSVCQKASLYME